LKGSVLNEQTIVIFGGGSAGIGIAHHFAGAMKSKERIYVVDKQGLVHEGLSEIPAHQKPFARSLAEVRKFSKSNHISLEEVVAVTKATVLIGVSAQAGAFTQEVVSKMGSRPIIFPLSNPQSKCEANPADLAKWTRGEAIIATGSPFDGFAQCNNVYIFPGVGLGVIAAQAKEVTDTMFYKAADVLSRFCEKPPALFPSFDKLPQISREIALGVMEVANAEGIAKYSDAKRLDELIWTPRY
jgi:malate dehydrogenase (oxaloacetate-decarboxylating)